MFLNQVTAVLTSSDRCERNWNAIIHADLSDLPLQADHLSAKQSSRIIIWKASSQPPFNNINVYKFLGQCSWRSKKRSRIQETLRVFYNLQLGISLEENGYCVESKTDAPILIE